jgi:hypothetical protein
MRVTAWNDGGDGYGIRVGEANRDRYFDPGWPGIEVEIGGEPCQFRLAGSFWRDCPEFRGKQIGDWLRLQGLAYWPVGSPPALELTPLDGNRFRLTQPDPGPQPSLFEKRS